MVIEDEIVVMQLLLCMQLYEMQKTATGTVYQSLQAIRISYAAEYLELSSSKRRAAYKVVHSIVRDSLSTEDRASEQDVAEARIRQALEA